MLSGGIYRHMYVIFSNLVNSNSLDVLCAKSLNHVQFIVTPWTVSLPECWSGLPFPPPGDLPNPGTEPYLLHVLHWQTDSLPLSHLGSP